MKRILLIRTDNKFPGWLVSPPLGIMYLASFLKERFDKNLDIGKVGETISVADELGYFVHGFFMIGFPTETPEEIQTTIDFAVKSDLAMATFFLVVSYQDTELSKMFRELGFQGSIKFEDLHYGSSRSFYQEFTGLNLFKLSIYSGC